MKIYAGGAGGVPETVEHDLTLNGNLTINGDLDFGSVTAGTIAFNTGEAVVAADYSIGRDADATNQLHLNVPTGASIEWSVNDVKVLGLGATGLLTSVPTGTGTIWDIALETEWTTGTLINADFASATVQDGNMIGISLDFNANLAGVTDQDVTGMIIKTSALTQSAANTTTYIGYNLPTAGALVQDTAAGTINWRGIQIQMPNQTQTTGTVNSRGISIEGGTITSGVGNGLYINMATAAAVAVKVDQGVAVFDDDIYTVAWTDYAGSSTIAGWDAGYTAKILYKKIGRLVYVAYQITGTSTAAATTFTLPYTAATLAGWAYQGINRVQDNGGAWVAAAYSLNQATNSVTLYATANAGNFTATGVKAVEDQFFYEAAS